MTQAPRTSLYVPVLADTGLWNWTPPTLNLGVMTRGPRRTLCYVPTPGDLSAWQWKSATNLALHLLPVVPPIPHALLKGVSSLSVNGSLQAKPGRALQATVSIHVGSRVRINTKMQHHHRH